MLRMLTTWIAFDSVFRYQRISFRTSTFVHAVHKALTSFAGESESEIDNKTDMATETAQGGADASLDSPTARARARKYKEQNFIVNALSPVLLCSAAKIGDQRELRFLLNDDSMVRYRVVDCFVPFFTLAPAKNASSLTHATANVVVATQKPNSADYDDRSPLHIAAAGGHLQVGPNSDVRSHICSGVVGYGVFGCRMVTTILTASGVAF